MTEDQPRTLASPAIRRPGSRCMQETSKRHRCGRSWWRCFRRCCPTAVRLGEPLHSGACSGRIGLTRMACRRGIRRWTRCQTGGRRSRVTFRRSPSRRRPASCPGSPSVAGGRRRHASLAKESAAFSARSLGPSPHTEDKSDLRWGARRRQTRRACRAAASRQGGACLRGVRRQAPWYGSCMHWVKKWTRMRPPGFLSDQCSAGFGWTDQVNSASWSANVPSARHFNSQPEPNWR